MNITPKDWILKGNVQVGRYTPPLAGHAKCAVCHRLMQAGQPCQAVRFAQPKLGGSVRFIHLTCLRGLVEQFDHEDTDAEFQEIRDQLAKGRRCDI